MLHYSYHTRIAWVSQAKNHNGCRVFLCMQLEQFWTTFHMPLLPSHDPKGMDLFGKQSAYG